MLSLSLVAENGSMKTCRNKFMYLQVLIIFQSNLFVRFFSFSIFFFLIINAIPMRFQNIG